MRKYTTRQLQAQNTKLKIYNTAVHLFDENGFDNTTIEDISKKAGVSVGAFYHYYASKTDIYFELFKRIDKYYEETVEPLLNDKDFYENIVLFFKHYATYNSDRGLDAVRQLYSTPNIGAFFVDKERYMYKLLYHALWQGKKENRLTTAMNMDEIIEFLYIMARGVVHDWVLHEADYEMPERMEKYLRALKPAIMR